MYSIDPSGMPDGLSSEELRTAVDAAFASWQSASAGALAFVYSAWGSPPPCSSDRVIRLTWIKGIFPWQTTAFAVTIPNYDRATGEVIGAVIAFNQDRLFGFPVVWKTDGTQADPFHVFADVQTITTHEIGHTLGLGHSDEVTDLTSGRNSSVTSPPSVMRATLPYLARSLRPDDVDGLNYLYGPSNPITTFGSVAVNAKFNGNVWAGPLTYYVACPFRVIIGQAVPGTTSNTPTGICTLTYGGGGPATSAPPAIKPNAVQVLGPDQTVSFQLDFVSSSQPPLGGFLMSSQGQDRTDGQVLTVTTAADPVVVSFDARTRSLAYNNGSIVSWKWSIDGSIASTASNFQQAFLIGTHSISLQVTDSRNLQSIFANATVIVSGITSVLTGSMQIPRVAHTSTLLNSGQVLVTGGLTSGGVLTNTAELYNPVTGTWRYTLSPMNTPRGFHQAVRLSDGRVLIIGAGVNGVASATAEIFDPNAESFTLTGNLATAHAGSFATALLNDGRVMAIAGRSSSSVCCSIDSVDIYSPVTGRWAAAAPLPTSGPGTVSPGYTNHTATTLTDGTVLVTGGYDGGSCNTAAAALRYSPSTDSWNILSPMLTPRNQHTATLLADGRVLIVAGRAACALTAMTSTELYDVTAPPNGISSAQSPLTASSRGSHTATLLPSGKVLVAGGSEYPQSACCNVANSSLQLYDPSSHTWTEAGPMMSARSFHTATLLLNGKYLLTGGFSVDGQGISNYLSSAELWTNIQ